MPPQSRTLEEEGVLIDNFLLVDQGEFREQHCDRSSPKPPIPLGMSIRILLTSRPKLPPM
jgi:N-methylhydantoinase B/oxoprolinase/acetone carboxylase alpha subunit